MIAFLCRTLLSEVSSYSGGSFRINFTQRENSLRSSSEMEAAFWTESSWTIVLRVRLHWYHQYMNVRRVRKRNCITGFYSIHISSLVYITVPHKYWLEQCRKKQTSMETETEEGEMFVLKKICSLLSSKIIGIHTSGSEEKLR